MLPAVETAYSRLRSIHGRDGPRLQPHGKGEIVPGNTLGTRNKRRQATSGEADAMSLRRDGAIPPDTRTARAQ